MYFLPRATEKDRQGILAIPFHNFIKLLHAIMSSKFPLVAYNVRFKILHYLLVNTYLLLFHVHDNPLKHLVQSLRIFCTLFKYNVQISLIKLAK